MGWEKDVERKREITLSRRLVGATLNCGLPTLINFGRFISSCLTRWGKNDRGGEGRRGPFYELARQRRADAHLIPY